MKTLLFTRPIGLGQIDTILQYMLESHTKAKTQTKKLKRLLALGGIDKCLVPLDLLGR